MLIIPTELRLSPVHGLGLFSVERIQKGQVVVRYHPAFDLLFSPSDYANLPPAFQEALDYYGTLHEPTQTRVYNVDNSRFINHSENPNLKVGRRIMKALRDIPPGEELTADYRAFCDACKTDMATAFAQTRSFIDEASLKRSAS